MNSPNTRKLELLAPARDKDVAFAAINAGADAVYMGFEKFGARASAGNSLQDIGQVVSYAHLFGVKVYVTLNTILYDEETEQAREAVRNLYAAGVDAIIVQDMAYVQMNECNMTLHASTQADNSTKEKVKWFEQLGFQRVVLAREMTIGQIRDIHKACPDMELEFFVHGALCCSFSGRCYLSLYQSGRSANRGECCQSCRSRYDLLDDKGETLIKDSCLLSTKDFNASAKIEELIEAGIVSFKIEGRLKDAGYVSNVTAYYSSLIDKFCTKNKQYSRPSYGKSILNFVPDVSRSFNRGFTIFNLEGKGEKTGNPAFTKSIGKAIGRVVECKNGTITINTKEKLHPSDGILFFDQNGNPEGFLVNEVSGSCIRPSRKVNPPAGTLLYRNKDTEFEKLICSKENKRKIGIIAHLGKGTLSFEAENGTKASVKTDFNLEICSKQEGYIDNLQRQIGKLGSTVFELTDLVCDCQEKYFYPNSVLAEMRRRCCEKLERELLSKNSAVHSQKLNKPSEYITDKVDYRENISNSLSEEFYRTMGVSVEQKALETAPAREETELMRSKNCIRYNLGQCLKRDKLSKGFEGRLFLRDNKHTYRLEFDCSSCTMSLWSIKDR